MDSNVRAAPGPVVDVLISLILLARCPDLYHIRCAFTSYQCCLNSEDLYSAVLQMGSLVCLDPVGLSAGPTSIGPPLKRVFHFTAASEQSSCK